MNKKIKNSIEDLKAGDQVWLRDDLEVGNQYGSNSFVDDMLKGQSVTVSCIFEVGHTLGATELNIKEDDGAWNYTSGMIDWDKTNQLTEQNLVNREFTGINKMRDFSELFAIEYDAEFIDESYDLEVKFAKINDDAKIPSKIDEDAGFDLYASFEEDYIEIKPHSMVLVPTGIKSSYSKEYMALIKERGSTGTKCMSVRAGVMDSGFRNEWKVVLNNTSDRAIYIAKNEEKMKYELIKHFMYNYDKLPKEGSTRQRYTPLKYAEKEYERSVIVYPYSKAIAQFLFVPVPKVKVTEVSVEEIDKDESERGLGMLGSSGK